MEETREEKIKRIMEQTRRLLQENFPRKGSTIDQIEESAEKIGEQIKCEIEESATAQEGRGYVGRFAICGCGCAARYVRVYGKEWQTTHGLLVIPRAYYYCRECREGFSPLDCTLGLDSGSTSLRVRDKIARLAAMTPFGRGAVELEALCGIGVSAKTFERVAELVGKRIGEEVAAFERHVLSGHADLPDVAPERLYVTVDGATVPIDDGWRECKVGAVYETSPGKDGEPVAHNIEHAGTMGNCEAIGDRIYALAFSRGVERAGEVVVLGDGAPWIWNQAQANFPECTQILDFYHATEHLAEVARARYGVDSPRAAKWLIQRKGDLLEGRFDRAIRSIRAWKPEEEEDLKVRSNNLAYLIRNKERMRYHEFRARGLHIGSGIAESSCKTLVQARLKQSGMHWSVAGADSILQLRRLWTDVPDVDFAQYASMAASNHKIGAHPRAAVSHV